MYGKKCLAPALLLCLMAGGARLHVLGADCYLKNGRLHVEAFFNDDTPARGAKVRVINAFQAEVAMGRTDENGNWSVAQPPPGVYSIHVDAGPGHQARIKLTVPKIDP